MGVGGIRPRSQGGKCRGLVNFVEIHEGEALQSWDILMRIMILEYETILGVSGYKLISCFHKWM